MLKTINLTEEKDLRLDSSLRWAVIYQSQTGHDILPDLLPILYAGADLALEIAKATGMKGEDPAKIIQALDSDTVKDAIVDLAGLQLTDLLTLVWSMARNAGDARSFEEFVAWADPFPLDVIVPEIFEMLVRTLVAGKNADRILTPLGMKRPTGPESQPTES